jgi:hypothetical protein
MMHRFCIHYSTFVILLTVVYVNVLCLVLLNFVIFVNSLLGRVSISHSSTVYEHIHIQVIIEQMMDP